MDIIAYRIQQCRRQCLEPKTLCSMSLDPRQFGVMFLPTWDSSASRLLESANYLSSRTTPCTNVRVIKAATALRFGSNKGDGAWEVRWVFHKFLPENAYLVYFCCIMPVTAGAKSRLCVRKNNVLEYKWTSSRCAVKLSWQHSIVYDIYDDV